MCPNPLHFHPLHITLQTTRRVRLGHHPAAMVCQLLKSAGSLAGLGGGFPGGIIPDAVEVGRMALDQGADYSFGLTLCDAGPAVCAQRWQRLRAAIQQIGKPADDQPPRLARGLGGNFTVARVQSLVDLCSDQPLPIPPDWIEDQVAAATRAKSLTIRWLSPLCASLPRRFGKKPGQYGDKRAGFFDAHRFPLADLAGRLVRRLRETLQYDLPPLEVKPSDLELLDPPALTRLNWIKWTYGPPQRLESLFGVMGRIVVRVRRTELIRPLVLGQFCHVGEKINFGLGRYIIEQAQAALPTHAPRHLRAPRTRSLADLAFAAPVIEREAERLNLSPARVRPLADQILRGQYQTGPVDRFLLPGNRPRLIAVPSRPERVLQRAVHELLAPVLDRFLTDSCQAYRRGLGRKTAAQRIHKAFGQGWRWALKADFHRFFDSVDHGLLRDKLEVYIQDDAMVELLMQWVAAGAPQPGRGLPTGAVVSPLLANLFLEQFDRQVHEDGGLLVRYADDFVLLFRDPGKGRQVLARAAEVAEQLKLRLNQDKTKLLDLENTPFDFLGFRFFSEKGWQCQADGLVQIEDLGWREAPRTRDAATRHNLPGEQGVESSRSGIWIVGPHVDWVGIEGKDVVCRSRQEGTEDRFQRRRVSELIVLGPATLDHSLFRQRGQDAMGLILADDAARWTCALTDQPPLELAGLVRAQVAAADDPQRVLQLARPLVAAKLINHAALAAAYPARGLSGALSQKLRSLAEQAQQAQQLDQLLGIEGAGAAAWYREFARRIDHRFSFERREHPAATDPVNAMLNLTQTILHRVICLTLVREGFAPSIGFLHQSGQRHAALASDLQEPFRHLMDRVVIEATYTIAPGEFHETSSGPFPLRMEAGTYRTLVAAVFRILATECIGSGAQAARSYRRHIATTTRSLHRHLLNPEAQFKIFQHW